MNNSVVSRFLCLALSGMAGVLQATARPPNIVIILADDLGYGDLGCYGHPTIRTPNLDRMAAEGMRFTDFYMAGCVCTPSRAALLTGRLPIRNGMAGSHSTRVIGSRHTGGLPQSEITIARALRARGYATMCIGKWHLAGGTPDALPTRHGFDAFYGLRWSNDMEAGGKKSPDEAGRTRDDPLWWNCALLRDETILEQPTDIRTLTARYTQEAVRFIRAHKRRPFLLYLAHTYPHTPLFATARFQGQSPRGLYGDVVEELDWSVGQVLEALRRERLDKNTLVFFTSDNGPWLQRKLDGGSAGLLREGKGSTWEGGMRVPGIAWWPGKIPPGVVTRELACAMDLFNTSLKLAGTAIPGDRILDGVDLSPVLFDNGKSLREVMFYYRGDELFAVRKGQFKAHFITAPGYGSGGRAPVFERHDPPLLFHLGRDPSEQFDVAREHPEVLAEIGREVEKHRAGLQPAPPQY
ncbi:MAG: sulfatase [Verrucomicrobiales bacterium]|nr:sulfatase [Verrucomicrobiales bacterium]